VFLPGFTPVATILADAREDLTAFAASDCPLAQAMEYQPAGAAEKEVKRRTNVVGIFPDDALNSTTPRDATLGGCCSASGSPVTC